MTIPTITQIVTQIEAREKAAYEKGWQDAVANIVAAARQGVPATTKPIEKTRTEPLRPERPIVTVIEDIIKEHPGWRGADIFREAVNRVEGSEFKTMDRTGRTALMRLKKRGKIMKREQRWYPVKDIALQITDERN